VRPQNAQGRALSARQIRTIEFQGAPTLPGKQVEWSVDETPEGHDSAALFSGTGDNLDRSIAREITVPASAPRLSLDTRWSTEPDFDSGFVQISTDAGRTWTSLGSEDTVTELSPAADPELVAKLPGLNGEGGWKTTTFSLEQYAGQTVWLGLRYLSDANTNGKGWWVDDVRVGEDLVSDGTTLTGWQTCTQLRPTPVAGYTVQVVGYSDVPRFGPVAHAEIELDGDRGTLDARTLPRGVRGDLSHVGVIVTYDEPTETVEQYAPYRLLVDGVLQPGGGLGPAGGAGDDPRV
jgi:hypothetical protein